MGFGFGLPPEEIRWTILTIGRPQMNKFWGETERRFRPAGCTSVLIHTASGLVLVDPTVEAALVPELLHVQAGVRPEDIRYVFVTHFHRDHYAGFNALSHATWLMAGKEITHWREQEVDSEANKVLAHLMPFDGVHFPGISTIPTPGHTPGHTSLLFKCQDRRVVVAGDAVMTEDHFRAGDDHVNSTDSNQARESLALLGRQADLIIPGHDVPFVVAWASVSK
jgi:glyoxylase-like metal-dependent hydrolase (beta-lactamase superfamily II)